MFDCSRVRKLRNEHSNILTIKQIETIQFNYFPSNILMYVHPSLIVLSHRLTYFSCFLTFNIRISNCNIRAKGLNDKFTQRIDIKSVTMTGR